MPDQHAQIIYIKRRSKHEEEHHGGAWKIAFADFMTAMMAFFLVLWIINATDKNTKTIIARYFNPVRLENAAKAKKGIHGGAQPTKDEQKEGAADPGETPDAPAAKAGASAPDKAADKSKQEILAALGAPVDPAAPKPSMPPSQLFADPYKASTLSARRNRRRQGRSNPARSSTRSAIRSGRSGRKLAAMVRRLSSAMRPARRRRTRRRRPNP